MVIRDSQRVAVCQRFAEAMHAPLSFTHPVQHYFHERRRMRLAGPHAGQADLATPVVLFPSEDQSGPEPGPHVALAKSLLHRLARRVA